MTNYDPYKDLTEVDENGVHVVTTPAIVNQDDSNTFSNGQPVTFEAFAEQMERDANWFLSGDLEDSDLFVAARRAEYLALVATSAVDALIDVHQRTGIDLAVWPPVLTLVQAVYPTFYPIPEENRSETERSRLYRGGGSDQYHTPVGRDTFQGAEEFPRTVWAEENE